MPSSSSQSSIDCPETHISCLGWRRLALISFAAAKPLLHLWSLGIEEQFYVLWPLLIYLAWKSRLNLLFLSAFILLFSFVLSVTTVNTDAVAGYYSPLTRFWELLMAEPWLTSPWIGPPSLQRSRSIPAPGPTSSSRSPRSWLERHSQYHIRVWRTADCRRDLDPRQGESFPRLVGAASHGRRRSYHLCWTRRLDKQPVARAP